MYSAINMITGEVCDSPGLQRLQLSVVLEVQTDIVDSQSEKMRELETNLAQANEFLEKVENVKEDALSAAEKSKEFVR